MLNSQPDDRMRTAVSDDRIRAALSRQFGRDYPPQTFQKRWFVKVGRPKWDDDEGRHKYKINITMNQSTNDTGSSAADSYYSQLSFVSTTARRSLQDFIWLEQALRAEYHGALIVPIFSLALYFGALSVAAGGEEESLASRSLATDATSKVTIDPLGNVVAQSFRFLDEKIERLNDTVDETILANWLSDIINGVRGSGEVILDNYVDVVVDSEAMETFLYRHSETTTGFGPLQLNQRASSLGSPFNILSVKDACQNKTFFQNLMENPLECLSIEPVCGGGRRRRAQDSKKQMPLLMCSSGTTGGTEHCNNSYSQADEADLAWLQSSPQGIVIHSELLDAERDLIASYLKSSSLAMSKVQSLTKEEAYVGQCWKRFAVSLSNLFAVEKDLESAHIGDHIKSNKKNQPFRKVRKSAVDDAVQMLAGGKVERSNPSLRTLGNMLNAYYADLNSTVPAFKKYTEAINQLDEVQSIKSKYTTSTGGNNEWHSSLEQLKNLTWGVTKQFTGRETVGSAESYDEWSTYGSSTLGTAQTKSLHARILANENMLKFSITLLCKASPLRNARMAWWYLKTEAKQAFIVHTAATALRQTLSIDPEAATAMKERSYDNDEKRDNACFASVFRYHHAILALRSGFALQSRVMENFSIFSFAKIRA